MCQNSFLLDHVLLFCKEEKNCYEYIYLYEAADSQLCFLQSAIFINILNLLKVR